MYFLFYHHCCAAQEGQEGVETIEYDSDADFGYVVYVEQHGSERSGDDLADFDTNMEVIFYYDSDSGNHKVQGHDSDSGGFSDARYWIVGCFRKTSEDTGAFYEIDTYTDSDPMTHNDVDDCIYDHMYSTTTSAPTEGARPLPPQQRTACQF